jgi:acyl-CoA thioester hydrolase
MPPIDEKAMNYIKRETRAAYPHVFGIPTRWMDNDRYGHVNNVNYY